MLKAANGAQGYDVIRELQARSGYLGLDDAQNDRAGHACEDARESPDVAGNAFHPLNREERIKESKLIGTEIGADIFLGKPFNDQELGSAVRNLLAEVA